MKELRQLFDSSSTILWDWNGTLLNDPPISLEIFNETIVQFGVPPITFETYQEVYGHPVSLMYERVGIDLNAVDFVEISRIWHDLYAPRALSSSLHTGAEEILELLTQREKEQHILSALPQILLDDAVDKRNIRRHFSQVSGLQPHEGSEKFVTGKRLIERSPHPTSSMVMIGDSSHDAEVARHLEVSCVLVANGYESKRRLLLNNIPVLDSLAELLELIS